MIPYTPESKIPVHDRISHIASLFNGHLLKEGEIIDFWEIHNIPITLSLYTQIDAFYLLQVNESLYVPSNYGSFNTWSGAYMGSCNVYNIENEWKSL